MSGRDFSEQMVTWHRDRKLCILCRGPTTLAPTGIQASTCKPCMDGLKARLADAITDSVTSGECWTCGESNRRTLVRWLWKGQCWGCGWTTFRVAISLWPAWIGTKIAGLMRRARRSRGTRT